MTSRWMTVTAAALAASAIGAGAAVAHDPGEHPAKPKAAGQAPWSKPKLTKNQNYLSSVMAGAWELGADGAPVQGSAARGSASFHVIDRNTLCYGLTVNGLADGDAPTLAHIHRGAIDENGPVVLELKAPPTGNPGWGGGCKDVDPKVLARIQRSPVNYYVNVHSGRFATGALRGQIAWTRWFTPAG